MTKDTRSSIFKPLIEGLGATEPSSAGGTPVGGSGGEGRGGGVQGGGGGCRDSGVSLERDVFTLVIKGETCVLNEQVQMICFLSSHFILSNINPQMQILLPGWKRFPRPTLNWNLSLIWISQSYSPFRFVLDIYIFCFQDVHQACILLSEEVLMCVQAERGEVRCVQHKSHQSPGGTGLD